MTHVSPAHSNHAAALETPVRRTGRDEPQQPRPNVERGPDRVELSAEARLASGAEAPFRADLVARVRDEIDRGVYETPERIDGAVEGILSGGDLFA